MVSSISICCFFFKFIFYKDLALFIVVFYLYCLSFTKLSYIFVNCCYKKKTNPFNFRIKFVNLNSTLFLFMYACVYKVSTFADRKTHTLEKLLFNLSIRGELNINRANIKILLISGATKVVSQFLQHIFVSLSLHNSYTCLRTGILIY